MSIEVWHRICYSYAVISALRPELTNVNEKLCFNIVCCCCVSSLLFFPSHFVSCRLVSVARYLSSTQWRGPCLLGRAPVCVCVFLLLFCAVCLVDERMCSGNGLINVTRTKRVCNINECLNGLDVRVCVGARTDRASEWERIWLSFVWFAVRGTGSLYENVRPVRDWARWVCAYAFRLRLGLSRYQNDRAVGKKKKNAHTFMANDQVWLCLMRCFCRPCGGFHIGVLRLKSAAKKKHYENIKINS